MKRTSSHLRNLKRLGDVAGLLAQRAEQVALRDAQRLAETRSLTDAADERLSEAERSLASRATVGRAIDPGLWRVEVATADDARERVKAARAAVEQAADTANGSQVAWLAEKRRDDMLDDQARDAVRSLRRGHEDRAADVVHLMQRRRHR